MNIEPSKDSIVIVRLHNPLDPSDHSRETMEWLQEKPLSSLIPAVQVEHVWSINGVIAQPDAIVYPGDVIVCCPVLHGGGGGKDILRVIAAIAITVAAIATGQFYAVAGAWGWASYAAAAAVSIGGSYLVNSMLPPATPTLSAVSDEGSYSGSSYGADGAKNVSEEGIPIPVVCGRFRVAGNLVSARTELDGDTQYLYLLLALCEGKLSAITNIKLNGTPISEFGTNVEIIRDRLGTANQTPIPWFNDNELMVFKGAKLMNTGYSQHTTSSEVDKLKINVIAPQGLIATNKNTGDTSAVEVFISAEYRKLGTTEWFHFKGSQDRILAKRIALPYEVEEIVEERPAIQYTKTTPYHTTVQKPITVKNTFYVIKSFRWQDTGEVIKDPRIIAEVRAAYAGRIAAMNRAYADSRRKKNHDGGRENGDRDSGSRGNDFSGDTDTGFDKGDFSGDTDTGFSS